MRRCLCVVLGVLWSFPAATTAAAATARSPQAPKAEVQSPQPAAPQSLVRGRVLDQSGAPIAGARVTITAGRAAPVPAITDQQGEFAVPVAAGAYTIRVAAENFVEVTRDISVASGAEEAILVTLEVAGLRETVTVDAPTGYAVADVSSATKTATPLRDVPQSVSVISRSLIADQRMTSMADVTRYMPGVGIAQGEGNRDTPILRGNSSTSDFFVDGIRDDVQYFRDVYNVDRVEALKGPNAMIFGRGGVGGVINRVTRQAAWGPSPEVSLQYGSWDNRRLTADVGGGLNETVAVRATGVYENSDSYRDGVGVERYGINPTVAVRIGANTTLRAGYEHFHDARVADRGVSSFNGRPVETVPGQFFGDPAQSPTEATVNLMSSLLEHRIGSSITLRNRVSYGDYDKFYQNVFPGAVNAAGTTVTISAYNTRTARQNLFNQTDLIVSRRTGPIGHRLLLGTEFGRQATANLRQTGYFTPAGPNVTSIQAPLTSPTISSPVTFRPSATDADNDGVAIIAAVYAQDQIALSPRLDAVVGLRFDSFKVDVTNNRSATELSGSDGLISPRAGLIFKPVAPLSVYGSYSLSHLPRAGEQLASLSLTNQALEPEQFRNYEVGAKWDVAPAFSLTAALYRLDRGNVVVPDPSDPALSVLVDAQRTQGFELGLNGNLTPAWSIAGGYAYQDGEITRSISATAQAGAVLAQLPRNSVSLWNKYDITPRVAAAVGLLYRGEAFAATDNTVLLPGWTRLDAAAFYSPLAKVRLQVNVENLLDTAYYVNAHSNTNITPGSPRAVRFAVTTRF